MKILTVTADEFDVYGDWLIGAAVERFISGCNGEPYTHVQCGKEIVEATIATHPDFPEWRGVMIGEQIQAP